ncbi:MAG: DsbE family thiol:disulfide interchange protein [Alphaproteobacteria bacterium]|nr:DsbE family thiol:disulfide interchange protein [Alphaproteobacteria bacterium]MBV9371270.1 DsbE family thiol:disulfide interchange protein [Alphaproteobacteria bacterium]MBV9902791.1 DsbE family thiol:disulfide interchange protein [Alphaproteobacteria bacterium]
MRRALIWLPLAVFAAFLLVFLLGLGKRDDPAIRSQMIGKPVPAFALAPAVPGHPGLAAADLARGGPRLVNVFASWCLPCRAEAPQLMALKRRGIPIDAVAIRDRGEDVAAFLRDYGDPFERVGADPRSQVQFALGSSGVPETFLVDGRGIIRLQHIGDIRPEEVDAIHAAWERAK